MLFCSIPCNNVLHELLQPAPGARSKEKFVSLPEELEELELPPPQLEVPPALFEVGLQCANHMHSMNDGLINTEYVPGQCSEHARNAVAAGHRHQ